MNPRPEPPAPTRRRFIGWTGVSLATACAGLAGWRYAKKAGALPTAPAQAVAPVAEVAPLAATPAPVSGLSVNAFSPYLGTDFQYTAKSNVPHNLRLVEVSPETVMKAPKVTYTSFSLLFETPAFATEGAVFHLSHAQAGEFDLYLSPVGDRKKKTFLEAIITQRTG